MARYAIMNGTLVTNIVKASAPADETWILEQPGMRVGWDYIDGKAVKPSGPSIEQQRESMVVTMRQARLVIEADGLTADVDALVATDVRYQITWEYSTEVRRLDVITLAIQALLGLSDEIVDDMFRRAKVM